MIIDRDEGGGDHVVELPILVLGELRDVEEAREIRMSPHLLVQRPNEAMNFSRTGQLDIGLLMASRNGDLALFGQDLSYSEDLLPSETLLCPHFGDGMKQSRDRRKRRAQRGLCSCD